MIAELEGTLHGPIAGKAVKEFSEQLKTSVDIRWTFSMFTETAMLRCFITLV